MNDQSIQPEALAENDHRRLGQKLDLFTFSDLVGSGLPLWLPKGATIRRTLERFIVDTEIAWGYHHVYTPDIAKLDLYKTSGHYPYYKDSMYAPIKIDEHEFMLRPMTCPHHFELYANRPRSYRELPLRFAELAKLYRYEGSGELSGLVRVRSFCLADSHIFCAGKEQAIEEMGKALDLIEYVSSVFGLKFGEDYWYRLSLGDRKDDKKFYKNDAAWDEGEELIRGLLKQRGVEFHEAQGEAAFYGPKIDIQMKDMRGKENTAFTVQYDFCLPDRFNLTYIDAAGEKQRTLVVHRSSIGAIERVMAFLIEHYAGAFPLWLAPVQVKLLPISETHLEYATGVKKELEQAGIRVELDESSESLGKKVRNAKLDKVPYFVVLGDQEAAGNTLGVEHRSDGKVGVLSTPAFITRLQGEIMAKK